MNDARELAIGVRRRNPAAIGRALTAIEGGGDQKAALLAALGSAPKVPVVALTGAPGAGKSTLAAGLVDRWCDEPRRVAALLVDPTSPITGGAVLGDRVRMRHRQDGRLFVRSLASRHRRDGLAPAIADAVMVLGAAGTELVLLETVGSGQIQAGAMEAADLVVLVHPPGLGDEVQAMKAGSLEVADCFVISKVDRDGAEATALEIEEMVHRSTRSARPVWRCSASTGEGIGEIAAGILAELRAPAGPAPDPIAIVGRLRAAIQGAVDDALGTSEGEEVVDRLVAEMVGGALSLGDASVLALGSLVRLIDPSACRERPPGGCQRRQ